MRFFVLSIFFITGIASISNAQILDVYQGKLYENDCQFNERFIRDNKIKSITGKISVKKDLQPISSKGLIVKYTFDDDGKLIEHIKTMSLRGGRIDTTQSSFSYSQNNQLVQKALFYVKAYDAYRFEYNDDKTIKTETVVRGANNNQYKFGFNKGTEKCEDVKELTKCSQYESALRKDMVPDVGVYAKKVSASGVFSIFNKITPTTTEVIVDQFEQPAFQQSGNFSSTVAGGLITNSVADFGSNYSNLSYTQSSKDPGTDYLLVKYNGTNTTTVYQKTGVSFSSAPTGDVYFEFSYSDVFLFNCSALPKGAYFRITYGSYTKDVYPLHYNYYPHWPGTTPLWKTMSTLLPNWVQGSDITIEVQGCGEVELAFDDIKLIDVNSCNCSDWLEPTTKGYYSRSVKDIEYPYQCLDQHFREANISTRKPLSRWNSSSNKYPLRGSKVNPAELDIDDFINLYEESWMDDLIKMHPLYCRLMACEVVNNPMNLLFEKRLSSTKTLEDLGHLNNGMNQFTGNTTDKIELHNTLTWLDVDPLMTSLSSTTHPNHWIYTNMEDKLTIYYSFSQTSGTCSATVDFSLAEMAMMMALGFSIDDFTCAQDMKDLLEDYVTSMNKSVYANCTSPVECHIYKMLHNSGTAEQYWMNFQRLYLAHRDYLMSGIYDGAPTCHTCSQWGLSSEVGAKNPFPKHDSKTGSVLGLVSSKLGISLGTPPDLTILTGRIGDSTSTNLEASCKAHLEYQIRNNYSIVKGHYGVSNPVDPNKDDAVLLASGNYVSVKDLIEDLLPNCVNPDTDPFFGSNPAPFTNINEVLIGRGAYASTDDKSVRFPMNPYNINPLSKLHNNRHLPITVAVSDCMPTTNLMGIVAKLAAYNGSKNCASWNNAVNSFTPDKMTVVTALLNGVETSDRIPTLNTAGTCNAVSAFNVEPLPKQFEKGLALDDKNFGGYYFKFTFSIGSDNYQFVFLSANQLYQLDPKRLSFGKNPAYNQRFNVVDLATHLDDFVKKVITPKSFSNYNGGGKDELPKAIWEAHYRNMLKNYLNFHTGLDLSYEDYKGVMVTGDVFAYIDYDQYGDGICTGCSRTAVESVLIERFDFYGANPMVCEDESDITCDCYDKYVTEFRNYILDSNATPGFEISASDIQMYFDTNITGYDTASTKVVEPQADYVGEMNNLFVVETSTDESARIDDLLKIFKQLFEDTAEPSQFPDKITSSTPAKVTISSKDLFPQFISPTPLPAHLCATHKRWSKGEFTFNDVSCTFFDDLHINPTRNFDGRLRTRLGYDGTFWIHQNFTNDNTLPIPLAGTKKDRYMDIFLKYEMYNWSYSMYDVKLVKSVEPIIYEEGDVFEFYLEVELSDGRVEKIKGSSSYDLGTVCEIPYAMLWDNPIGYRPETQWGCDQRVYEDALKKGENDYLAYLKDLKDKMYDKINKECAQTSEMLAYTYSTDIYNHTLYYYDQAGNLVQTIPPEGIDQKFGMNQVPVNQNTPNEYYEADPTILAQIKTNRDGGTGFLQPNHKLATKYEYNTLNQIVKQTTPDAGVTEFWYDKLGRIVLSQNAEQKLRSARSYTIYDGLSRVTETGELTNPIVLTTYQTSNNIVRLYDDLKLTILGSSRKHVVKTTYNEKLSHLTEVTDLQENLINRVSVMMYYEDFGLSSAITGYENAVYYSYDVSGNVKTLWRHINDVGMSVVKRVDYNYDLISGNVKQVRYQVGKEDMLIHRYMYDADNRINLVQVSRDDLIFHKAAAYQYYLHGPLSRTSLDKNAVQGIDYAYTLQGWIKQVNGFSDMSRSYPTLTVEDDGQSGKQAKDAFAYVLHYNKSASNSDYEPVGGTNVTTTIQQPNSGLVSLYNGNIPAMDVKYSDDGVDKQYLKNYRYDQLNRIKHYEEPTIAYNPSILTVDQKLGEYIFDGNGNLTRLKRKKPLYNSTAGDYDMVIENDLEYGYDYDSQNRLENNRLNTIKDKFAIPAKQNGEFEYDAIGNLTKDTRERTEIMWNPIGKVDSVTTRGMYFYDPDYYRSGMDMKFEYGPLGHRLYKQVKRFDGEHRDCYYYEVKFKFTNHMDEFTFKKFYTCDFEGFHIGFLDNDEYLYYKSLWYANDIETNASIYEFSILDQVPAIEFTLADRHTEYYIRDAQGNNLATYNRKLEIVKTQQNLSHLVDNILIYLEGPQGSVYDHGQLKEDFVVNDLGRRTDFINNTYELLGFGDDPEIDIAQILNDNTELVYHLNESYQDMYADLFFSERTEEFKQVFRNTDAFQQRLMNVIIEEMNQDPVSLNMGQEEFDNEALMRFEEITNSEEPPPTRYFNEDWMKDEPEAFSGELYEGFVEEVLYTNEDYIQLLVDHLYADPINEEELYTIESKPDLFVRQYELQPSQYVQLLVDRTDYYGNESMAIADWILANPNYGFAELLERAAEIADLGLDVKDEILGITPNRHGTDMPYTFEYAYDFELAEHYMYGSSRLGTMQSQKYVKQENPLIAKHTAGHTLYELNDHLGNVRTVISDRRILDPANGDEADVLEQSDYYPYGMVMEERYTKKVSNTKDYENFAKLHAVTKIDQNAGNNGVVTHGSEPVFSTNYDFDAGWHYDAEGIEGNAPEDNVWGKNSDLYSANGYDYVKAYNQTATGGELEFYYPTGTTGGNGGTIDYTRFKMHVHDLPYSGSNSSFDTLVVEFEVKMQNAEFKGIGLTFHGNAFDEIPTNITYQAWTTVRDTVRINSATKALYFRGIIRNPNVDAKVRFRNFKYTKLIIDNFVPTPLQEREKSEYRFGFNNMEANSEFGWQEKGFTSVPDYLWEDDFSDAPSFEESFATAANMNSWTAGQSSGQPCAVWENNAGTPRMKLATSSNNCGATSKEIDIYANKKYTLSLEIEKPASNAASNLQVFWEYLSGATWVNIATITPITGKHTYTENNIISGVKTRIRLESSNGASNALLAYVYTVKINEGLTNWSTSNTISSYRGPIDNKQGKLNLPIICDNSIADGTALTVASTPAIIVRKTGSPHTIYYTYETITSFSGLPMSILMAPSLVIEQRNTGSTTWNHLQNVDAGSYGNTGPITYDYTFTPTMDEIRIRVTVPNCITTLYPGLLSYYFDDIYISDESFASVPHKDRNKNHYDFTARMYNPLIGKFMSTDPWEAKYPWQSAYAYYANSPTSKVDWKGYGDVDDNITVNEKGDVTNYEKTDDKEHHLFVENSVTGKKTEVTLNDPKNDQDLIGGSSIGDHLVDFVNQENVNWFMDNSGVPLDGMVLGSTPGFIIGSSFGQFDYAVSQLWGGMGTGGEDIYSVNEADATPRLLVFNTEMIAYNIMDAGNWLWGYSGEKMGYSHGELVFGSNVHSLIFNEGWSLDSKSDQKAIKSGWKSGMNYRIDLNKSKGISKPGFVGGSEGRR